MEIYTPKTNVFHTAVSLPQDLVDKRTAQSVRVGIEAALDNSSYATARLSEYLGTTYTGNVFVMTDSVSSVLPAKYIPYSGDQSSSPWTLALPGLDPSDVVVVHATINVVTEYATGSFELATMGESDLVGSRVLVGQLNTPGLLSVVHLTGSFSSPGGNIVGVKYAMVSYGSATPFVTITGRNIITATRYRVAS